MAVRARGQGVELLLEDAEEDEACLRSVRPGGAAGVAVEP
jgi:hypothetical protein